MQGLTKRQCQEMILGLDVLSFPDDDLMWYHFSLQFTMYLHNLIRPLITSIAQMLISSGLINKLNGIKVIECVWKKKSWLGIKLHTEIATD